jgi:hypothetical protein
MSAAVLLRCGLAAWLASAPPLDPRPTPQVPTKPSPTAMLGGGPLAAALASIILRLTTEIVHA